MKPGLRARLKFTERLGFRLAFLLSVALLPLGLIALAQTWRMAADAERAAESALIQRTSDVVAGERAVIQSALGAAGALGQAVLEQVNDPAACSGILRDYIARSPIYSFVGFIPTSGLMTCTSEGTPYDVTGTGTYRAFMAAPGTHVTATDSGMVSGRPAIVITQPVTKDGTLLGMLSMSVTHQTLRALRSGIGDDQHVQVVMVNDAGEVLFAEDHSIDDAVALLPRERSAGQLVLDGTGIFRGKDGQDKTRVFTVLPAVPGQVYIIGSWPTDVAQLGSDLISPSTLLFPLTMWLTSLIVAYAAVDRLVIRHVRELRGQMRRFALGRRDTPPEILRSAPSEIAEVSHTFHNVARILIRDEAELERSLQEKTVLLKEIHHRVKNNLQLIASIMNMQIRQVKEPGARRVLKSVQDRVASLATIHRNLYQAESLSAVEADVLLGDIVNQMTVMSKSPGSDLRIETELQKVSLYPDQAVPVSLLATEALTNAVKYATVPPGGTHRWIRVSLSADETGKALLEIANSRGGPEQPGDEVGRSGLGTQLINAFASQLGAAAETEEAPDSYHLRLHFEVARIETDDGLPPASAMAPAAIAASLQRF